MEVEKINKYTWKDR